MQKHKKIQKTQKNTEKTQKYKNTGKYKNTEKPKKHEKQKQKNTRKYKFSGNIFVKGRAKDTSCRQSFGDSPNLKNGTSAYTLSLGKCGMQRLRSVI